MNHLVEQTLEGLVHLVLLHVACARCDVRLRKSQIVAVFPDLLADLIAVHLRHLAVADNQAVVGILHRVHGLKAILSLVDELVKNELVVPHFLEGLLDHRPKTLEVERLVVDQQNSLLLVVALANLCNRALVVVQSLQKSSLQRKIDARNRYFACCSVILI